MSPCTHHFLNFASLDNFVNSTHHSIADHCGDAFRKTFLRIGKVHYGSLVRICAYRCALVRIGERLCVSVRVCAYRSGVTLARESMQLIGLPTFGGYSLYVL
ncbi:hypothetical protein Tcan_16865 [Toxocara canis]|uniref:Uncharacterized protein n=1 Tax=Toxocara canis TaxID=6265 RepID=A0A0B2V221_TOXCA|nr:hypothetical protein Tcan_16865 [Toxocara canis]